METRLIRLILNDMYAVVEEVKPSSRAGYAGDARTYIVETSKVLHLLDGEDYV